MLGLLFESQAALLRVLERRLDRDSGLSVQWFEVLVRLHRAPDNRLRMSDLAAMTTLTPSGLTRAVDRLEAAGLVVRESSPSDRRSSLAVLTPEGRDRIETALPIQLRHVDDVLGDALSVEEELVLAELLRRLRDAVKPAAAKADTWQDELSTS
jgi:DNA-binding MarR family transcriptional regulator